MRRARHFVRNSSVVISVIIRELPVPEVNEPGRMHPVLPIPSFSPVAASHPVPAGSPGSLLPPGEILTTRKFFLRLTLKRV